MLASLEAELRAEVLQVVAKAFPAARASIFRRVDKQVVAATFEWGLDRCSVEVSCGPLSHLAYAYHSVSCELIRAGCDVLDARMGIRDLVDQ